MAATKKAAGAKPVALPPMTVQRFEESLQLVEAIAKAERSGFLAEMQAFRDEHRAATRRPLTAEEATRFAAAMVDAYAGEAPEQVAGRLQGSELYGYEDPSPREVLTAAGLATAPALLRAVRSFVALIEMDPERFETACESDALPAVIEGDADILSRATMTEGRARALAAFEHWGKEVGVDSGEAMRRLIETVTGALEQAAMRVTAANLSPGLSHLSTSSPAPTDGDGATSSTTPATATP